MSAVARRGRSNRSSFTVDVKLYRDHYAPISLKALVDTGAEQKLLISLEAAARAVLAGAVRRKLKFPKNLTDFRGRPAGQITEKIVMTLDLAGRRFPNETFLVTNCHQDVFIGQHWLDAQDVWLHPRTQQLRWPQEQVSQPPSMPVARVSEVPRTEPEGDDDVVIARITTQLDQDPRMDRWEARTMPTTPLKMQDDPEPRPTANISALLKGDAPWRTYTKKPIPFPAGEDPEHVKLVRSKLPAPIAHLEGFFSKKASTKLPPSRPGYDVVLELEKPTKGSPPQFRTPVQYMPLEKETVDELLKIGFIERCMDPNAASVLFVPKAHGSDRRFCVDYRWLNQFLKQQLVPAPDLNGTFFNNRNAKRWTKIDIIRAFNRLLLSVDSRHLSAFRTRQGTFRWKVLPFGLKVGPAWWQRFINAQLNELLDLFTSAYADDVLVSDSDKDEAAHWPKVEEVIYRLAKADLQGDINKSEFNVTKVNYLGMVMEAGKGLRIDPDKIKAITEWRIEELTNRTAVRSFLGLCNYVRMFVHHASTVAGPLNDLLKKDAPFEIGPAQQQAFQQLKDLCAKDPVIAFFVPDRRTRLEADASRNGVGAIVWQLQPDNQWKPTGYFSKTMTLTERAYPIQDRELLAVVLALEHYQAELLGSRLEVVTDHQALTYYATKRLLSTRQVRWAEFLSNFDIQWRYRPGSENVGADALSRKTAEIPTVKERERAERTLILIDPGKIAGVREVDPPNATAKASPLTGAELVDKILKENEAQELGRHQGRIVVPEVARDGTFLWTALIREAHEPKVFAHAGQNKTIQTLKRRYFWDGMTKTIRQYIRNCHACCRHKTRHDRTPGLLHPLPVPNAVWEHVAVDGKDMPRDKHGYDYVWAFVCKLSKIIVRLPARKTDNAERLASRYYQKVYSLLGVPAAWYTDNGGPFVSAFMAKINELTGTKHRFGSALHPQTQGSVEITNQELDQNMQFYVDHYQTDWSDHLPAIDFAHNSSWHSSIDMAPLKVLLGQDVRDPLSSDLPEDIGDIMNDQQTRARKIVEQAKRVQDLARENALASQRRQEAQANKKRRPVDFGVGDHVFLKKKGFATNAPTTRLDARWAGPFKITEVRGFSYVLDLPPSFKSKNLFHADRLRKAPMDPLPGQRIDPPPPEDINGEAEYLVERVKASRLFGRNRTLQYQVDWVGGDPDDVWYPAKNFKNSPVRLNDFHKAHPDAAGPPVRLEAWMRAAAEDVFDGDHELDDVAEHGEMNKRRQRKRRHE